MKFLVLTVLALSLVSCSSSVVNDYKIKASNSVGQAVEHTLAAQYVNVTVEGKDCVAEAKVTGEVAKVKVMELLKAKETLIASSVQDKAFASRSVGSVVPMLCSFVISNVLPGLINDNASEYACLRALGSDKMVKVGNDLCGLISL